jgi:hypothetical protein
VLLAGKQPLILLRNVVRKRILLFLHLTPDLTDLVSQILTDLLLRSPVFLVTGLVNLLHLLLQHPPVLAIVLHQLLLLQLLHTLIHLLQLHLVTQLQLPHLIDVLVMRIPVPQHKLLNFSPHFPLLLPYPLPILLLQP